MVLLSFARCLCQGEVFSVVMGERRGYFKVLHLYHHKTPILAGTTVEGIAIHLSVSGQLSMHTRQPVTDCVCPLAVCAPHD